MECPRLLPTRILLLVVVRVGAVGQRREVAKVGEGGREGERQKSGRVAARRAPLCVSETDRLKACTVLVYRKEMPFHLYQTVLVSYPIVGWWWWWW